MRPLFQALLFSGLLSAPVAAQAQQPTPAPTLSDDSVRVMSGLVQTSVRQLRDIYFEPSDARAVQLIDKALLEIPVLNQRLSRYTASLPREQQQLLAQRLRQHPWQIELQTLMRSPQFRSFDARAAKNAELKVATERLHASGFVGTAKVAPPVAATPAPEPMGTISLPPAKSGPVKAARTKPAANALASAKPGAASKSGTGFSVPSLGAPAKTAPVASAAPAPAATAASTATAQHTVQKGETLFSISRRYGVTPAQLQEWNNKASGAVKIGEVLVVNQGK
ncbi:LysM peptidoglycan-binding domain-containing protein [Hymenobacter sp. BT635]|uniref:LysM peptidoglycan-binding domain-containing protein n=1 Tax=Hymenobacter nitidus TaxID=2880929 RepID=A0ABS8ACM5_9BACT|nr:LysM peptidoglycan-binding domain-containing protein [Hymenobacter nitidus]MCB2378046.1 LysM peptidoglycan-binding domain-containing protein [Hymenobacter nitidus]